GDACGDQIDPAIDCLIRGIDNALVGCPRLGLMCGGIAGVPCAFGEVCDIHDPTCAVADAGGVCAAITHCPLLFVFPVCGCDGVTYRNDCRRLRAGVTLR